MDASFDILTNTYHFTLPHNIPSIRSNAQTCRFPDVNHSKLRRTNKRDENAMSRRRRKVGERDEPGARIEERNGRPSKVEVFESRDGGV